MLPTDLARVLPESITSEQISHHCVLRAGLTGSLGETHLAYASPRLLVLERGSALSPAKCHDASLRPLPRLEPGAWKVGFHITLASDDEPYELAIPANDLRSLLPMLKALYQQRRAWPELATALAQAAEISRNNDDRAAHLSELAAVRFHRLDDPDASLRDYLAVLRLTSYAPSSDVIKGIFLVLTPSPERYPEELEEIEKLLRRGEQWRPLVKVLKMSTDVLEDETQAIKKLIATAEIQLQRLNAPSDALKTLGRALRLKPTEITVLTQIEALASQHNIWLIAAATFERLAVDEDAEITDVERRELSRRAAVIFTERLNDPEAAARCYEHLLASAPHNPLAIEAIRPLLQRLERWPRWVEVTQTLAAQSPDLGDKKTAYRAAADACERHLNDVSTAIDCHQAILDADDRDREALSEIARLAEKLPDWDRVISSLEALFELTSEAPGKLTLLAKIATVHENSREDPSAAIESWQRAVAIDERHLDALEQLGRLYEQEALWLEFMEILQRQIWATEGVDAHVAIHRRLAWVWSTHLKNPKQALEQWESILALAPTDVESMRQIRAICTELHLHARLEEILSLMLLAKGFSSEQRIDLLMQLAELITERPGERDAEAAEVWEQIFTLTPKNMKALDALESIYTRLQRWPELIETLDRQKRLLRSPADNAPLLMRIAEAIEAHLDDPDRAKAIYAEILAVRPLHSRAFAALARLYQSAEDFDGLLQLYVERVEHLEDPKEAMKLRLKTADLTESNGTMQQMALDLRLAALPLAWRDPKLAIALARSGVQLGVWDDVLLAYQKLRADGLISSNTDLLTFKKRLRDHIRALETLSEKDSERSEILWSIAEFYDHTLALHREAIPFYQKVLAEDPSHDPATQRLRKLYPRSEMWSDYVLLLRAQLEHVRTKDEKTELYETIAHTYEVRLKQPDEALATRREARRHEGINWTLIFLLVVFFGGLGMMALAMVARYLK